MLQELKNRIEVLETENKELQTKLKGLSFANKKTNVMFDKYKNNLEDIKSLKKDVENLQQTEHIQNVNEFHNIVNGLVSELQKYEGTFINKDGSTPKKLKDFISKLDLQGIHVYTTQRYSFGSAEIVFSGKGNLKHTIYVDSLNNFTPLKNYDVNTIVEAQENHNKLLKEFQELKSKLQENYYTATADYNIHHNGKEYQF